MARKIQTGFEIGTIPSATGASANPDGVENAADYTSTNFARTGARSLRVNNGTASARADFSFTPSTNRAYYRFYVYIVSPPTNDTNVFMYFTGASFGTLRFDSSSRLGIYDFTGVLVGQSESLPSSQWLLVEVDADGTATPSIMTLRINGATVASGSVVNSSVRPERAVFYCQDTSMDVYVDDLVINDTSGSVNNSWPGPGSVVLMMPTSDVQDGTWTIASGGNTNLFDAVNNRPVRATSPSAASDGNRIESIDGSGNNTTDEAIFGLGSYTAAGIPAGAVINAIRPIIVAGEEANTGTKSISFGMYSNPAGSLNAVADVTNGQSGAVGTYPTAWWWQNGTIIETPSVTLGNDVQMNLRKTDASTRSATVGFIGAYVDYTPGLAYPHCPPVVNLLHLLAR